MSGLPVENSIVGYMNKLCFTVLHSPLTLTSDSLVWKKKKLKAGFRSICSSLKLPEGTQSPKWFNRNCSLDIYSALNLAPMHAFYPMSSYLFTRIWKKKKNLDHSVTIFLLWSHKNFLYSKFQSLGNRAASLEETVAICSTYKIAYFPLATLQRFGWKERILLSGETGVLNLAYCQNLAVGGREVVCFFFNLKKKKAIYRSHQFGDWLKILHH